MIKFIFFTLFIAFCFLTAFAQSYPTKALKKTFNEVQLRDIESIANYMDSLVHHHHPKLDESTAYHAFFDSLRINFLENESNNGKLNIDEIAIDEVVKYKFLASLDTTTFNDIWIDEIPLMVRTRDTLIENPPNYHSLDINNQGKVMDYFKRLGKRSKSFKSIHELIEMSGSIGPTLFGGMFYKHDNLNFNNIDDRLWAAIFYLTIEESIEKKIERYYK
jgi:hypothetical protein